MVQIGDGARTAIKTLDLEWLKIDIPHILSQGTKVVYLTLVSFLNCGYFRL